MEITVLYFAITRERLGLESERVEVSQGARVGDLWAVLVEKHAALAGLRRHLRIAVNHDFADDDRVLAQGDEVALIPPVAGGAGWCRLSEAPLDAAAVEAKVARPEAGAVVTFRGVVRDHTGDRRVNHLEYEVYPEMALAKLEEICLEVTDRWPGCRAAIEHRHGRLEIGETAVVIAVSSAHRAEAFEGCRHAIERIKQSVPIWKKEVGPEGQEWVGFGS